MNINTILKYVVLGGLFLVPFIPFIVSSFLFFPFITGKGFLFRILVEIISGAYIALACADPAYRPKRSWISIAIGVFTLTLLVADVFGVNTYKSIWSNYERMEGFVLIAHLALYYLVASSVFDKRRWHQFLNVSIVASAFISLYGVLQLTGKAVINQGGVRLDATFGNSAYLAIYLVIHIFLCLYMYVHMGRPEGRPTWQKWYYLLLAFFEMCILYFTATRGAILGLIGGLILTALLIIWKEKENKKIRRYAYSMIGAVGLLFVLFLGIRNTDFVQKSPVLSRFASLSTSEIQSQGRYYVWPMALKGIAENPILGWGQENFNFVFNKNYNPRMFGQEQWFDRTHNVFLDWLIAGGIVGFASYASLYVALLYYVWRKKSTLSVSEKSVLTGLISAYIFHNIFVFDNLVSYIMFFSILGYIHSAQAVEHHIHEKHRGYSKDILNYLVLPLACIATIGVVYYVNVPAIQASETLIKAITPQTGTGPDKNLELFKQVFEYNSFGSSEALEQLVQISVQIMATQDVPDSIKEQFYNYTKSKVEEKIKQTPTDARYLVFAGSFFSRFGQYDVAIDYFNKALEQSPRKQSIYFELGSTYLGKGDTKKAFDIFKEAYNFETTSPESKVIYTIGALYAGQTSVVQEMLTQIDSSVIISDNRFLQTYARLGNYQAVIAILNERIKQDPTNLQYQLSLASAYVEIGQKQRAIVIIQEMINNNPTFKTQGEQYIQQIENAK